MPVCVVLSTAPDVATGRKLGRELVRRKLAACVTVGGGAVSCYRWKGRVQTSTEALLVVKTSRRMLARLRRAIRELHPYELPEVVAIPVTGGCPDYLKWVTQSVG